MAEVNQLERAQRAWGALTAAAAARKLCTYKSLGDFIGVHHRAIRYVLAPIQDYCLETHLPPLTILVVNGSGKPGTGFIAHDTNDLESGVESVCSFKWADVPNPFDFAAEGLSYIGLLNALTTIPENAEAVYHRVKSRGIQQILFRDAVKKAYRKQCAFSGTSFPDALQASHIVPWSVATPQQRMDVRNGILLNPLHHCLFDKAYITITTDYRMVYWDPKGTNHSHSSLEAKLTIDLHNKLMRVPHLSRLRPLPDYIDKHNELIDWPVG